MSKRTICVDFDNTIHDMSRIPFGKKMGPPLPGAKDAMHFLSMNYRVVVLSARADKIAAKASIEQWLKYFLIPFDEVTAVKPPAVLYIDDRGYRFSDWPQFFKDLPNLQGRF